MWFYFLVFRKGGVKGGGPWVKGSTGFRASGRFVIAFSGVCRVV